VATLKILLTAQLITASRGHCHLQYYVKEKELGQWLPHSRLGKGHGGGICQFSVSYDNDQTFYATEEIDGGCPDGRIHALNAFAFTATNMMLFFL
jgi:hypothetical protein